MSTTTPELTGYEFAGWNTNANGTGTSYSAGSKVTGYTTSARSKTLYAQWTPSGPTDDGKGITVIKTRVSINGDTSETIAGPGDEILWNITVTNLSNVEKTVKLTEQVDGKYVYFEDTNTSEQTVTLAAGKSTTVTAKYTVTRNDKGMIVNTVVAETDKPNEKKTATDEPGTAVKPGTTTGTFTIKKSFEGLGADVDGPQVTLTYKAYRTKDGVKSGNDETGTVVLTKQSDGTYAGTINPTIWDIGTSKVQDNYLVEEVRLRYKNVVEITEDPNSAAVDGHTHDSFGPKYSADATASGNTVTFVMDGATSEKTLSVENTYTAMPKDKPALTIEKSVDKTSIKVGGELTYTIKVTNSGKAAATNVVVADTLPAELTYVSKSTTGASECQAQGNDLTWNLGAIAANGWVEFTFKAKTDRTGNISNAAIVNCAEKVTDTSDPVPTAIYSFKVEKGNDGFVSTKGKATVHYTVTITNNGTINLYGLNVKDVLTPTFKINNAALTAEQAAKVDMVLKNVTVTGADKTLSGNDLSVTDKTTTSWQSVLARNAVFAPNAEVKVEYDIEIANKTGQTLYVDLSNTATCGTWTSQEPQIITFSLRDADDGYVEESATSSASTGTSGAGGTIDPEDPDEPSTPDLEVTKTAMVFGPDGKLKGTDKAEPGDTIKYQIEVTNNGGAADNVVITDVLNSNLEFVKAEGNGNIKVWDTEPEDGHYVIGSLAASDQQTGWFGYVEITAKVKAGTPNGTISNTAYVTCDDMTTPKPSNEVEVEVDDGTPTEYVTVTYKDGETKVDKDESLVKGSDYTVKDLPNTVIPPDGQEFDCWEDANGTKYTPNQKINPETDLVLTAVWKDKGTEPETGKVTITVEFKDGDKVVKQVIEKVEKDSEYDVTDETEKLPKGYVSAGEPTGEVSGIADDDKTITVPVTKAPVEPKEKVTITIEYVDEDGTTVVKSIVETVDKGTAYDKTDEVENGIPADYTLDDAREITGEVSGTADDNVTITVPVKWSPDDPDKPQPTDTVEITIEYVDEDGNPVKTVTEKVETGTDYDKTDEATNGIPDGYELADNLPENVAGTADDNVTITVPVKKATEPEPAQVTITVKYVDEDGTEVKTVIETVDKGTAYDKSAEVENDIPNGYQANGEPTGDALIGTAEADVTITVPVKKSGSGSEEPEYVTVTWRNGYDGGQVGATQQVTKGITNVSRDLYPADPTRADYTFSGWSDPVTGADGNITITAQWTYNSGSSGNGGSSSSGTTPTPPVDIEDEDPPLANVDGNLNTTDHFAYIIGRGEDCVQPLENITRAEVATIFFRLLTEEYRVANWSTVSSFPDVEAGAWYSTEIATAEKAGILKGCDDGNMQPDRDITRAEFTVMAIRFLNGSIEDDGVGDFADTADHWAAKEIRLAAKAGWIKGYGNEFRPNDPITRAEAMTIINRMLDRVPGETFPAGTIEWGDNPTDAWYYADVMEATNGHDYEREEGSVVEKWTAITPYRDWIALEAEWTANNGASASAQ